MIRNRKKSTGEPWVWLTAMGLAVGLIMVAGLLGLIMVKGLEVFWPKRVAELQIQNQMGNLETLLGEIVLKQNKRLSPPGPGGKEIVREWQLFLGNREVLGQAFRFIDTENIKKETYPKDALVLERKEYGDVLGYPLALQQGQGKIIPAESPDFSKILSKKVRETNQRWANINEIEKNQIGKINRKIEKINREEKAFKEEPHPDDATLSKLKSLEKQKVKLQSRYEGLAATARDLRAQQKDGTLQLRLADGREQKIEIGQILHYYYPNRLNTLDRLSLFFGNMGRFLSEDPREANTEGGIFPALFGTLVMTILMSLAVVPFGVLGAVYLHEYAKPGPVVRLVRIAVNNLAGVPSIVFGVFGLGFFVYILGGTLDSLFFSDRLPTPTFGTGGLLWASLTLALLTVPVVIVSTEEALSAVSREIREGALACGASKWQSVKNILLPASAPGVLTGAILAMARGAGEVAPLMLVGVVKLAPTLPLNTTFPFVHLDQKFMHLGFHIYDLGFQSPDSEAAKPMVFATTLLLIALVLILNLGAIIVRERLRKKYATGTF